MFGFLRISRKLKLKKISKVKQVRKTSSGGDSGRSVEPCQGLRRICGTVDQRLRNSRYLDLSGFIWIKSGSVEPVRTCLLSLALLLDKKGDDVRINETQQNVSMTTVRGCICVCVSGGVLFKRLLIDDIVVNIAVTAAAVIPSSYTIISNQYPLQTRS